VEKYSTLEDNAGKKGILVVGPPRGTKGFFLVRVFKAGEGKNAKSFRPPRKTRKCRNNMDCQEANQQKKY